MNINEICLSLFYREIEIATVAQRSSCLSACLTHCLTQQSKCLDATTYGALSHAGTVAHALELGLLPLL